VLPGVAITPRSRSAVREPGPFRTNVYKTVLAAKCCQSIAAADAARSFTIIASSRTGRREKTHRELMERSLMLVTAACAKDRFYGQGRPRSAKTAMPTAPRCREEAVPPRPTHRRRIRPVGTPENA